ncbi:DUF58 domain-containing protein [Marinobacterium rhizophilum]|uniref:DUF58 domain-containing protein n=1 Tax=Marinobacterium rhizophilum TaxID=420402 RepID=UPI002104710A|nr:DUF58 domain-containing protein [Marinobacterium rhizophilum]
MTAAWRRRIGARARRWALGRHEPARTLTLTQNRVFIFPTRAGFWFLFTALVILLLGINYENNLVYAVSFVLLSLFVVSILHTYSNLAGLSITALSARPCLVGENAEFELLLRAGRRRTYEALQLSWIEQVPVNCDLIDDTERRVRLYAPATERGWWRPGALLIETHYPLGLLRAWTWLETDFRALAYPRPLAGGLLPPGVGSGERGTVASGRGSEDFAGLETYQKGMSPRHIAWKQLAAGQGLHAKQFVDHADEQLWLDWTFWPELETEQRLSRLCYWTLRLAEQGVEYGLRLPGVEIAPGSGGRHRHQVLRALALHGQASQ